MKLHSLQFDTIKWKQSRTSDYWRQHDQMDVARWMKWTLNTEESQKKIITVC